MSEKKEGRDEQMLSEQQHTPFTNEIIIYNMEHDASDQSRQIGCYMHTSEM